MTLPCSSGRIAFSLQLLLELERPVYDLSGQHLMDGWQPADLVAVIQAQEAFHAANGWAHAFDFHRPHTPYPDALRRSVRRSGDRADGAGRARHRGESWARQGVRDRARAGGLPVSR